MGSTDFTIVGWERLTNFKSKVIVESAIKPIEEYCYFNFNFDFKAIIKVIDF